MPSVCSFILAGTYRDSVFLMNLSQTLTIKSGANQVFATMATRRNKELLARAGLLTPEIETAKPDDLAVAIDAPVELHDNLLKMTREYLYSNSASSYGSNYISSISFDDAVLGDSKKQIALISVPGDYARYEAARALEKRLDVMLYSDNISLEDEIALKKMAKRKGVLLMGPECGTSIVNGVPLGFANNIRRGEIGIVSSSGTGAQEVSCLLDRCGLGITTAYGTGARDLIDDVGGISAITALERLASDPNTKLILVIANLPGIQTRKRLIEVYKKTKKPVFVRYLGSYDYSIEEKAGIDFASDLTELANMAINELAPILDSSAINLPQAPALPEKNNYHGRKFIRGIFSGGTMRSDAIDIITSKLTGTYKVYSNFERENVISLTGTDKSREHCFLDMGANEFTVGRPHSLVSPETKLERIIMELCSPETAILITDIVIGYGTAKNQASLLVQAFDKAARITNGKSREVIVLSSVCGTDNDLPSRSSEIEILKDAGIFVFGSNAAAANYAADLINIYNS